MLGLDMEAIGGYSTNLQFLCTESRASRTASFQNQFENKFRNELNTLGIVVVVVVVLVDLWGGSLESAGTD